MTALPRIPEFLSISVERSVCGWVVLFFEVLCTCGGISYTLLVIHAFSGRGYSVFVVRGGNLCVNDEKS